MCHVLNASAPYRVFVWQEGVPMYEGQLQSSWTHLTTPSRNFVEV